MCPALLHLSAFGKHRLGGCTSCITSSSSAAVFLQESGCPGLTLHCITPGQKRVTLWPLTTLQHSQTLPQFRLVSQFCSHHQCLSHAGAQPGILHSWHSLLPLLLSQMHQGHSRRLFDFITGTGTELGTRFHLQK